VLMTRGLWPDPIDEKVAASDPAGEEDSSGGPASGECLHVNEAKKARIPFPSSDDSCLTASAQMKERRRDPVPELRRHGPNERMCRARRCLTGVRRRA
jgi:hypothetical protein